MSSIHQMNTTVASSAHATLVAMMTAIQANLNQLTNMFLNHDHGATYGAAALRTNASASTLTNPGSFSAIGSIAGTVPAAFWDDRLM